MSRWGIIGAGDFDAARILKAIDVTEEHGDLGRATNLSAQLGTNGPTLLAAVVGVYQTIKKNEGGI